MVASSVLDNNLKINKQNDTFETELVFEAYEKENNDRKLSFSKNRSDALPLKSLNDSDEQERFVTMGQETIDGNKLPKNFDQGTIKEKFHHLMEHADQYFPNIPESLRYILPAMFQNGDCSRPMSEIPDWLDKKKFFRGQQFAQRFSAGILTCLMISLFQTYLLVSRLKLLGFILKPKPTQRAYKRYLFIARSFLSWYTYDPWTEGTEAYNKIKVVRKLHINYRQQSYIMSPEILKKANQFKEKNICSPIYNIIIEDFKDACPLLESMQCPFQMTTGENISQEYMSAIQFMSMGLILLYPEKFGAHNVSDENLDACSHFLQGIGYLLGIEDKNNFYRGSLQDVRNRMTHFIEYWVKPLLQRASPEWEHMNSSTMNGINNHVSIISYEASLLYFCDILNVKMPRLYKSLSFYQKVMYMFYKFLFSYVMKIPGVHMFFNFVLTTYINEGKSNDNFTWLCRLTKLLEGII